MESEDSQGKDLECVQSWKIGHFPCKVTYSIPLDVVAAIPASAPASVFTYTV